MKTLKVKTDANGMKYTSYEEVENKQKPLSDEEIRKIRIETPSSIGSIDFARAIERAHGIS